MPLIPQQDIIYVPWRLSPGGERLESIDLLKKHLESYPPCRIVSITADNFALVAVIETI